MDFFGFFGDLVDNFRTGLSYLDDLVDPRTPFRTAQEFGRDLRAAGNTIPPVIPDGMIVPPRGNPYPIEGIRPYRFNIGDFLRLIPRDPVRMRKPKILEAGGELSDDRRGALLEILSSLRA